MIADRSVPSGSTHDKSSSNKRIPTVLEATTAAQIGRRRKLGDRLHQVNQKRHRREVLLRIGPERLRGRAQLGAGVRRRVVVAAHDVGNGAGARSEVVHQRGNVRADAGNAPQHLLRTADRLGEEAAGVWYLPTVVGDVHQLAGGVDVPAVAGDGLGVGLGGAQVAIGTRGQLEHLLHHTAALLAAVLAEVALGGVDENVGVVANRLGVALLEEGLVLGHQAAKVAAKLGNQN